MRLEHLVAEPHPDGHRIDLAWINPDPAGYPGARVVRREETHPVTPEDGVIVAHGLLAPLASDESARGRGRVRVSDSALRGETLFYYSVFPYRGDPPEFSIDRANRVAALTTSPNGASIQMQELLPAVYRRYDATAGQLRRFLELPGGQLDVLRSFARALLDAIVLEQTDGRLLPLLADWIGWPTDFHLEIDRQRNEIRNAPAVYQRVGMIPVVEATVKRISGWESRSKEFVHNVARSNQPPRLNIWARRIPANGTAESADTLLSLDFAFDGRPAVATDDHGVSWMVYHTVRRGRCRIWYKTSPTFRLPPQARAHLEAPDIVRLQQDFAAVGVTLAADATVTAAGSLWHVDDATNARVYVLEQDREGLTAYETSADPLMWAPSRPLVEKGSGIDEKHPAMALQQDVLWVFWAAHDPVADRWEIRYRTRRDGSWSPGWRVFTHGSGASAPERRAPAVLVDQDNALWLFWQERVGRRWQLRYNRYSPTGLTTDPPDPGAWELDPAATFPLDGTEHPRVESDVSVLFHPTAASRPIWVFWARKEALADPRQTRWTVAYRFKAGTDPTVSDWSPVATLPRGDTHAHDREPAARVVADGQLTVYWSSDRADSWSVWRASLDPAPTPPAWSGMAQVTSAPYDQRDPLPVSIDDDTVLLYRSNESLTHASGVYDATRTVDFRYAGTTTPHVRHTARLGMRGAFEDFQTYTHDTGSTREDWYRRDTLGVYLAPETMDPAELERGIGRLDRVLPEFMAATDRAVLIPDRRLHVDYAYTYDAAAAVDPRWIGDEYRDALTPAPVDLALEGDEDFVDDME